mgnify:CR=1 FL=1
MIHFTLLCVIAIGSVMFSSYSHASKYTPEGIYDPIIYQLDNGMRVILKPRQGARNVAIRLDVGIGNYDFTCDKQETAHFLEHLLFTGTSKHTEIELDELITKHGGTWNAYTYDESTVYEVDIFSEHIEVALETLSEIISDSIITADNFDLSRTIIYREMGGKPSAIRQFLYKHEIVGSASHKSRKVILKGNRSYCNNLDTLKDIKFQDILDAYAYFYVPNNMALIITGDFDTELIKNLIKQQFGELMKKEIKRNIPAAEDYNEGPVSFSSSFKPLVGISSSAGLIFRTVGYESPDYYPLLVIAEYLTKRLYEKIRVQEGLTYAPEAQMMQSRQDGVFLLRAETTTKNTEKVITLMHDEVIKFREGDVTDDEIAETITSILLNWARGLESNSSIADYYIDALNDVDTKGYYVDQESHLEKITPEDVRKTVERYFTDSKMGYLISKPTLTYNQLYLLLFLTAIGAIFITWLLAKKMHLRIQVIRKKEEKLSNE